MLLAPGLGNRCSEDNKGYYMSGRNKAAYFAFYFFFFPWLNRFAGALCRSGRWGPEHGALGLPLGSAVRMGGHASSPRGSWPHVRDPQTQP